MFTVQVRSRIVGTDDHLPNVALSLLTETLTIRELIANTVEEQIRDLQLQRQMDIESIRNILSRQYLTDADVKSLAKQIGAVKMPELPTPIKINIPDQIEKAQIAFQKGVYLIFVDGEQAESLDQTVMLKMTSKITFLRLTPLKGG